MTRDRIRYRSGYKYVLAEDYTVRVAVIPRQMVVHDYFALGCAGDLKVFRGYAWDGPSGPTIDTPNFMRGSLIHDCLYQMMREGLLDRSWREVADQELRRICREDGMSAIRAWWVYHGVRLGGGPAAMLGGDAPVLEAP